jgi:uncharacterized membrane protein
VPTEEIQNTLPEVTLPINAIHITGPAQVYPYDIVEYQIHNIQGGEWLLSNKRARIVNFSDTSVKVEIVTGKSGDITLTYRYKTDNMHDVKYNIEILSL